MWQYRLGRDRPQDWGEWQDIADGTTLLFSWIMKPAYVNFRRKPVR